MRDRQPPASQEREGGVRCLGRLDLAAWEPVWEGRPEMGRGLGIGGDDNPVTNHHRREEGQRSKNKVECPARGPEKELQLGIV